MHTEKSPQQFVLNRFIKLQFRYAHVTIIEYALLTTGVQHYVTRDDEYQYRYTVSYRTELALLIYRCSTSDLGGTTIR